jgi:hypothetical protein
MPGGVTPEPWGVGEADSVPMIVPWCVRHESIALPSNRYQASSDWN